MISIGIFDSGIGGLSVVKEIKRHLPYVDIIYFGDTARLPYGTKSQSTIIKFSIENILFLLKQGVKLIVIACNTSSSIALSVVRRHFRIPIIGVIQPGAREAVRISKNKRIGVIGTPATIRSGAYEKEIERIDCRIKVVSQACPLFVPLVEEGWLDGKIAPAVANKYLSPLKKYKIDTLILGCTHYPLLKPTIKKVIGPGVTLVDSAKQVALEVKRALENEEAIPKLARSIRKPRQIFYISDEPQGFSRLARRFLGYPLEDVRKVKDV
jgi:glutamate racemase